MVVIRLSMESIENSPLLRYHVTAMLRMFLISRPLTRQVASWAISVGDNEPTSSGTLSTKFCHTRTRSCSVSEGKVMWIWARDRTAGSMVRPRFVVRKMIPKIARVNTGRTRVIGRNTRAVAIATVTFEVLCLP